jgi:hypothetical protein
MNGLNLGLLLIGLIGLTGFTLSNWSTVLPLTFLGVSLAAQPLPIWVLGAIAAGSLTTIAVNSLFALSNYATARGMQAEFKQNRQGFWNRFETDGPEKDRLKTPWPGRSQPRPDYVAPEPPPRSPEPPLRKPTNSMDDWDLPPQVDWNDPPSPRDRASATSTQFSGEPPRSVSSVNRAEHSQANSQQRDRPPVSPRYPETPPSEKVVDADYRVIIPPFQGTETPFIPPPSPPEESADDWFEDDAQGRR